MVDMIDLYRCNCFSSLMESEGGVLSRKPYSVCGAQDIYHGVLFLGGGT